MLEISEISKFNLFSKLDLVKGFWQIGELEEEDRNIFSFATKFGKFRFKEITFLVLLIHLKFFQIVLEKIYSRKMDLNF